MKKLIPTLLIIFFFSLTINAQNYAQLWTQVQRHEVNNLPKSANKIVESIYTKAEKENNGPQLIKSLFYQSKFILILEEDAQLKVINNFKKQITKSKFPTKNVLQNILANLYWQYHTKYRYKIYRRTKTANKTNNNDFRTWDINTLFEEIHLYYNASLKNSKELQKINISQFSNILQTIEAPEKYHPTLYDFLANNALTFYKTSENNITKPAYQFKIDKPSFLSDANSFSKLSLNSKDTLSLQFNALKIYQQLTELHLKSNNLNALGNIDLNRLNFIKQYATFTNKNETYLQTVQTTYNTYKNHEVSGLYAFETAKNHFNLANLYNYSKKKQDRFKNKEAFNLCNKIIHDFPNSLGAKKCTILKNKITNKSLLITTEKYIPKNSNSRVLINYKNIEHLFFNVYKINAKQLEDFHTTNYKEDKKIEFINSLEKTIHWKASLRNEKDYLKHTTEIVIPKIKKGNYLIVASENQKISKGSIYGTSILQATNLVIVQNNSYNTNSYQVLDRNTGKPISNAKINLKNKKHYKNPIINKNLITDINGFASFKSNSYYSNVIAEVSTHDDHAIFGDFYLNKSYNKNATNIDDDIYIKPFVFTDRSIYRPGQKVYFKVIAIQNQDDTSSVFKNEYIEIVLEDANGQEVKKMELKLNEFGSVAGEFAIPNNGLTGRYTIYVDEGYEHDSKFYDNADYEFDDNEYSFSVEEYKRPKFETDFKPITKTFKINDSVTINGFAKAFSGSNITDAKVIYRVHRKVQYPAWCYWRIPNLKTSSQEITHGESSTNSKGEFEITFKAIPDENVTKENLPVFSYEITADVTDINGETRSKTTTIKVGYHTVLASISVNNKIDKNSKENNLQITTKNLNGEFIPANGTVKIYKLQAPKNPQKPRLWNTPDYQDISELEFRTLFPNEPYFAKESDVNNWKKGKLVFNKTFDTKKSKEILLNNTKNWDSGKYIILLESKDKFGQLVKDEKKITLFSTKENKVPDSNLFFINTDKNSYQPNDNIALQLGSASKDMTVIIQIEKNHKIIKTSLIHLNNETKNIQIPVTNNDIGGFAIKYYFVNYNYFKNGNLLINVPEKIKNINIETNVFRNKLQPGQDETWSFTVKNDKNDQVTAEILASMYDASLDEFKSHDWQFNPIAAKQTYYSYASSNAHISFAKTNYRISNLHGNYVSYPTITSQNFNWFGFSLTNKWLNKSYLRETKQKLESQRQEFDGTLSGIVTDEEGQPIPFVNITITNTTYGVTSDLEGKFSINAIKGDNILFNFIGYSPKNITVNKDFNKVNITLKEKAGTLDEIVIVGYGTRKEKSFTGAVTKASIDNALRGRIAGVNLQAEEDTRIVIRGTGSISGNSAPLIVVDGIALGTDSNLLSSMNPNNIADLNILKDASSTAIYGSRGANGVIIITTKKGQAKIDKELSKVKARTNLQETAFFFPQLKTNKNGEVSFNFTAPEALTRWKLQLLAHTKDAKSTIKTLQTVTQKELMVVPNAPRFLRQGDTIVLSAKISNLTKNPLNGFAQLQLTDALTEKEINIDVHNLKKNKNFTIDAKGNTNVSWNLTIPYTIEAIQYKIVAKSGDFSDGEQNVLPVLTNRMLVTETIPMWVRSNQTKTFTLDKLKNNTSSSLINHKLTLEITSNPVWYAVQALPYLMEYPYECAEQTFSRYYANTIASFVANSNPKIQEVFNAWKSSDALLSNLEKNQELKSLLIQETPWLRDAQSESEQKKRIALLFDLTKMKNEQEKAINKLKDIQKNSGGFPWFKGGRYESTFITQHIATGFGHLQKLGISDFDTSTDKMIKKAVSFLDKELIKQHDRLFENARKIREKTKNKIKGEKAYKQYLAKNNLSYFTIQYLYMRSFYNDINLNKNTQIAIDYYTHQTIKYWNDYNLYAKGQIALSLFRNNQKPTATKILKSLKENSITSDELGMYWKENIAGYYYYQAPIETQALLIETFTEIENDTKTVDNLKIWLLKNKQTNRWKTTKATTEAVYALLLNGSDWISVEETVDVIIGDKKIAPKKLKNVKAEAGTGYFKTSWNRDEITPKMAEVTISKKENGIAWGGLYWQYFEDLDKITSAETPLKLNKKLFLKINSDTGKELKEINSQTNLKVGDLITVRIVLRSDRNMEFIHMKDMRASGVEPINVLSKYKYQDGLGYYESTKDAATNFFIDRLPKGTYVFEYDVRVNNAGNFSNGITTIQSMYAPEFSSHSKGERISIE